MTLYAVMANVKAVLDGLDIPGDTGPLTAYIIPPDPDDNRDGTPRASIWDADGGTSRLTLGRNSQTGSGGSKQRKHNIAIFLWYPMADEEENEDSAFPSVLTTVMYALEHTPDPVVLTDPFTGEVSQMNGLGEDMTWRMPPPLALASQRWEMFDAMIIAPVREEYDP